MICEIISIGTEILLGNIVDTNTQFLSETLSLLGIDVYHHSVVGDNLERLIEQINLSKTRSDIIITTGGLGPTEDDITKEGLSRALDIEMRLCDDSLQKIENYFKKAKSKMDNINLKQAYMPLGAIPIENNNGTAPGVIYEKDDKIFILLPGPPKEMKPMFLEKVLPYLKGKSNDTIISQTVKVVGIGEAALENMLKELIMHQTNPTIALYAKEGEVQVRITAKTKNVEIANRIINESLKKIKAILGNNIYGYDGDTLESVVVDLLQKNNKTISLAESCTGGLISSRLIGVPSASKNYMNGIICYSNKAKVDIVTVKQSTLETFGAVSEETAKEMAEGVKNISNTDIGLSITGIAGPEGGTKEKPVGLCYIGLQMNDISSIYEFYFNGNREKIRNYASTKALDILRRELLKL